jgi:chromosome segregation ATPase
MDQAGKIAGTIVACLGLASTIFGILLLRWLYISVKVKTLREEIDYLAREVDRKNGDIKEKDEELGKLRQEFSHWKQRFLEMQKQLVEIQQALMRRVAQILSLREYIERLEATVLELGGKLPKKDRVRWDEEA